LNTVHLTAASESQKPSLKYESFHRNEITFDQLFQFTSLNNIFIFHLSPETYNSSILTVEFHQSLVTLPSHHSSTANELFHIVLIVSHNDILSLTSFSKIFVFKSAFQFTKTT
jgi:hypothetical protein